MDEIFSLSIEYANYIMLFAVASTGFLAVILAMSYIVDSLKRD